MKKALPPEFVSVSFSEILPLWQTELWPERKSPIEATSSVDIRGDINPNLHAFSQKRPPQFFALRLDSQIIGTLSYQWTASAQARLRGLWVAAPFRHQGLGALLIKSTLDRCQSQGARLIWTMARESAWPFYQRQGFKESSRISGYDYGPHVLCQYVVASPSSETNWLKRRFPFFFSQP